MTGSIRRLSVVHIGKFYPPERGGMETYLEMLCRRQIETMDVSVVVANRGPLTVHDRVDGVSVTRLGTRTAVAGASWTPGLRDFLRQTAADIVHLHAPNPTATLAYLASGHRGKLIVSWHSDIVRQRILGALFEPIMQRVLRRSRAVIVASPDYLRSSASLAAHRSKCHVIPYGIDEARLTSPTPDLIESIRARWGDRIVLAVGRLTAYKGFEYLIRAMVGVNGRLLLIGDGPERMRLEAEIAAAGVSDKVELLGNVRSVNPYYHAAQVFVLPSIARSEAFGIVQLEAMAAGTPVVNTELNSGVTFVSVGGETGLTVPPRDPAALARAISLLLEDRELAVQYGVGGTKRIRQLFTAGRMVAETDALYERVMHGDG